MKKSRTHEKSLSVGFASAKEITNAYEYEPAMVEATAKEVNPEKPLVVLWYSKEALDDTRLTGLRMVYGDNVEIDEVYDVPCHIASIRERIKRANIVALGVSRHDDLDEVFAPFLNADQYKSTSWDFIYTYMDADAKNCWNYYRLEPYRFKRLVSFNQIRVWKDLTTNPKIKYHWAVFLPQAPMEPAYIAMLLDEGEGKVRLYRYSFAESHEFDRDDRPMLKYWINSNELDTLPNTDYDKIARATNDSVYANHVLGYTFHEYPIEYIEDIENPDFNAELGGYFTPLYIEDFNIPSVRNAASM